MLLPRPLRTAALAALALTLAACASTTPPPSPEAAPSPPPVQELGFRVLDSRDRPLPSARLTVVPLAGRPEAPGPYQADREGMIRLPWRPQVQAAKLGRGVADRILLVRTALEWRVTAPGHFPAEGKLNLQDKSRRMAAQELKSLNRSAKLWPHGTTVVLRRLEEVWGGELATRPADDPLKRACLRFVESHGPVALRLGAAFAWPAFGLDKGTLTLRFNWQGAPWRGTTRAPLAARVALLAGLPLLMALGQDFLPQDGVQSLRLVFRGQVFPAGDEHAMPQPVRVELAAPADQVRALAQGRIRPGPFLGAHPPRLISQSPGS